jgi:hypothetical protein
VRGEGENKKSGSRGETVREKIERLRREGERMRGERRQNEKRRQ